jgi:ribosomal protein S18 acetylase RimI-like enzyme
VEIRPFAWADEEAVVGLWERCGLVKPQNDPRKDIRRKMKVRPELFLVGVHQGEIVACVMAGYEGHRGWLNYLAVDPRCQRQGMAREIVSAAEALLREAGCPKINLQVRSANKGVIAFYERIGYSVDDVVSMGKRLEKDGAGAVGKGVSIGAEDPLGPAAEELVKALCTEMAGRYGREPSPFSMAELAGARAIFLVARMDGQPVGCGAIRRFDEKTAEVKRMYVAQSARGRGIARRILAELEKFAREAGYELVKLETGTLQPEAQGLYKSLGYYPIPSFGKYLEDPTSVCFEKSLRG